MDKSKRHHKKEVTRGIYLVEGQIFTYSNLRSLQIATGQNSRVIGLLTKIDS